MLLGYARVSSADQNPDHQTDALARAGVAAEDIHIDHASGAKASRPKLDLVLRLLRDGDTLVITRLDRLGRSVLHLITLGSELRHRVEQVLSDELFVPVFEKLSVDIATMKLHLQLTG